MTTLKQIYANHLKTVFEQWKQRVREDRKIQSSKTLGESALGDSIPKVLEAIAMALTFDWDDDFDEFVEASLEHGRVRFQQGFDAREVAREYRLLRQTIFDNLEQPLLRLSPQEQYRSVRLIDAVLDEAIAQCFKQFLQEQIQDVESVRQQQLINNQEIARLLQLNQENFSFLAHEIKNPLTAIMGHAQMLLAQQQAKGVEDPLSFKHIERVLRSSRQLLQLVNDALEISRSTTGQKQLQLVSVEVETTIRSCVSLMEPLAKAKELEIKIDLDNSPKTIITDVTCLSQIITNLFSNAVRYTDQGGVEIECILLSDDQWLLSVTDTGIGIPDDEQQLIFEPFTRASSNTSKYRDGSTGLGLTIVAQQVKQLQGEIKVFSSIGEGSRFEAIFPLEVKSVISNQ